MSDRVPIRGLCVGGLGDGRWFTNDGPRLRVAEPPRPMPITVDSLLSASEPLSIKFDTYTAEPFAMTFPEGYTRRWWIWRLDSMSPSDCVDMLFNGYRRP